MAPRSIPKRPLSRWERLTYRLWLWWSRWLSWPLYVAKDVAKALGVVAKQIGVKDWLTGIFLLAITALYIWWVVIPSVKAVLQRLSNFPN